MAPGTKRRWHTGLAGAALLAAMTLSAMRILARVGPPGHCGDRECVLADFRDVVYYPVVAYLRGENPYDRAAFMRAYPVAGSLGLYSPLTLGVHLPFGLLPFESAARAYFVLGLTLTVALGALGLHLCGVDATLARVLGLGALVMLGRPGHWNLFIGQVSLPVVMATYVALSFARTRVVLAGLGLALATLKPTYGLPLAVLMLARGDRRAVLIGLALAVALTALVVIPLVAPIGVAALASSMATGYAQMKSVPRPPATWPFRVDVIVLSGWLLGRWPHPLVTRGLTVAVLAFAAAGLRRLAGRDDRDARILGLGLASTAIAACTYHNQYDLVVLTAPLVSVLWPAGTLWAARPRLRFATLALLTLPFANYAASRTGAEALHLGPRGFLLACAADNLALLGALAIFGTLALAGAGYSKSPSPQVR